MAPQKTGTDRLLTIAIVVLSVAGVLYFGLRAILDRPGSEGPNPYALDLTAFEQDADIPVAYAQVQAISFNSKHALSMARDDDGNLYVSTLMGILKFDAAGKRLDSFTVEGAATCLAVDSQQQLYLGMGDRVEKLDASGNRVEAWETLGPNAVVTSIAASDSVVYVADAGQLRVWKFTPSGTLLNTVGMKDELKGVPGYVIPSPYFDVAIGLDGTLWAANTGRHSLENYTSAGYLNQSWGEYGTAIDEFCGCCNPSHFAILNDGGFVTSEKGIPRVKVYDREGQFVALVARTDQFKDRTVGLDLATDDVGRIYVLDPAQEAVRVFEKSQAN